MQLTAAIVLPGHAGAATPISPDNVGVNFSGTPPDLATASTAGVGLAREQVIAGSNTDAVVELTAAAGLRLYPMLGLPRTQGPATDAVAMAAFVTSFAERYGAGGSFWGQHPELPYLPVESFEIGNEPDITPTAPADETSLHYEDPNAYAEVYEAARAALHQVDPTAQAVVGGMLDSGAIGLDQVERYLGAIAPMDAVGYHPYLYDATLMEQDTVALRRWLDANGDGRVPLDINEFGAALGVTAGSAAWGSEVAQYTQWALCTPGLDVEDIQPLWWGAVPSADADPWFSLVNSELSETPLGTAYLGEVEALTSEGCPAVAPTRPQAPAQSGTAATKRNAPTRKKVKRAHKPAKGPNHRKRRHPRSHKPAPRRPTRSRSAKRR